FLASWRTDAAANPGHVARMYLVIVVQNGPGPEVCRQLILGQADALSLEVPRVFYAILANVYRRVSKGSRQEYRYGDIWAVPAGQADKVAGKRELGDVEVHAAHRTEEHLLGTHQHEYRADAV